MSLTINMIKPKAVIAKCRIGPQRPFIWTNINYVYLRLIKHRSAKFPRKSLSMLTECCNLYDLKVVKHIEMPKAGPKKSICHFQKLEMILK